MLKTRLAVGWRQALRTINRRAHLSTLPGGGRRSPDLPMVLGRPAANALNRCAPLLLLLSVCPQNTQTAVHARFGAASRENWPRPCRELAAQDRSQYFTFRATHLSSPVISVTCFQTLHLMCRPDF